MKIETATMQQWNSTSLIRKSWITMPNFMIFNIWLASFIKRTIFYILNTMICLATKTLFISFCLAVYSQYNCVHIIYSNKAHIIYAGLPVGDVYYFVSWNYALTYLFLLLLQFPFSLCDEPTHPALIRFRICDGIHNITWTGYTLYEMVTILWHKLWSCRICVYVYRYM